jgi:GT2 family glycosyltransferase
MPNVSVIIPTYNRAHLVDEAIDSVLAQTYRDHEIIVVDDGSTDDTQQVLQSYGDAIRLVTRRNGGSCAARNTGLEQAQGDYIAFLDSDDLFLPGKLELQLKGFDRFPSAGMIYSRSLRFEHGRGLDDRLLGTYVGHAPGELQDIFEDMLLLKRAPLTHDTLVRRNCFTEVGGFDTQLRVATDHDMWLRVSARCQVAFVDAAVAAYRQHDSQMSNQSRLRGEYARDLDYILDKAAHDLPPARRTAQVSRAIARARALVDVHRACHLFFAEGRERGISHFWQTLHSGELLPADSPQVSSIVISYAVAADAADATLCQGLDLLHAMWESLPPSYRHLRRSLRRHLAFRHHDRAGLAARRGDKLAAVADTVRWLRYRNPWCAPALAKRVLAAGSAHRKQSCSSPGR